MSGATAPPSSRSRDPLSTDALHHAAAGYEALRAHITGSSPSRAGVGLGVLLQHGLSAWWEAVRTAMRTATRESPLRMGPAAAVIPCNAQVASRPLVESPRSDLITADQRGDVVTLLAGLVLSARPRPTHHDPAFSPGVSV